MLFYSNEARQSAIDEIGRIIKVVSTVRGDALSYSDASSIIKYLGMLQDKIKLEVTK